MIVYRIYAMYYYSGNKLNWVIDTGPGSDKKIYDYIVVEGAAALVTVSASDPKSNPKAWLCAHGKITAIPGMYVDEKICAVTTSGLATSFARFCRILLRTILRARSSAVRASDS